MNTKADAAALLAWMDDAHAAIDLGHCISPVMALALAATPTTTPGRLTDPTTAARTWFLEEYEQMMRRQLRDPVPFGGTTEDIDTWRDKQSARAEDMAQLLHMHSVCLLAARAFVARKPLTGPVATLTGQTPRAHTKSRPKRETAAEQALRTMQEAA